MQKPHKPMDMIKEQRIAKHKDFAKANWRLLAAFAWEHYLAEGRGMVVVPEDDFVHADRPQYALLRVRYVPAESPEIKSMPDWEDGKEQGWLETYDPERKVIVLIVRPGGGTSGYLLGANPPPPECHAIDKCKEN